MHALARPTRLDQRDEGAGLHCRREGKQYLIAIAKPGELCWMG